MEIEFVGAAQTVTGSMHLLRAGGKTFSFDCGLFQGRRAEGIERNSHFPIPPEKLDILLLSHAHIDHSGLVPKLVKAGFGGPIYATPATADLLMTELLRAGLATTRECCRIRNRR